MSALTDAPTTAVRRWWALAALCVSLLTVTIHTSILTVALPSLVRGIGANDSQLQWIVDSDYVAFAGMLLTGAALADRFGRRGVMVLGLLVCGAASAAAALSSTASELIIWRTVMGASSALVMPATLSILVNVFTEARQRRVAIATWSLMNAVGAFIGPVAGGLLLRWFSWNACFWVTVPFAIVASAMAYTVVPTSRDPDAARFDILGAALSTTALGTLVWGIIEGPTKGWADPAILVAFAIAVVTMIAFVRWELRTAAPMIDLSAFRNRQLAAATVALTIAFLAMTSAMYLAQLSMQLVKGYTPLAAAIGASGPITVVNFMVVPLAPSLIRRFGYRILISVGTAVIGVSALVLSSVTLGSSYLTYGVGFALMALAFGTFVPASTEAIMTAVPPERSGGASAVNQLTRTVGQSLGIALGGGIAAIGYHSRFSAAGHGLAPSAQKKADGSLSGALAVAAKVGDGTRSAFLTAAKGAYLHGVQMSLIAGAVMAVTGSIYAAIAIPARTRDRDRIKIIENPDELALATESD